MTKNIMKIVKQKYEDGDFKLVEDNNAAGILYDKNDCKVVEIAANHLRQDIERVTGSSPVISTNLENINHNAVIIGTIGQSKYIDRLIQENKIDHSGISGKWETHALQVIKKPFENVSSALVIFGSDRRAVAYGIYELSKQIGVSPWYWWADVPVKKKKNIYISSGRHTSGEPAVKYRGFFINDEAPAITNWAYEKFGGFNHEFYEKVFELILRLKGNYIWTAMWNNAFLDDDPANAPTADDYGIVIGTSHHEPMMRAYIEWRRYGTGPWNYEKNEKVLKEFWVQGIKRRGSLESIVTVGMRGDGDEPMTEQANIALLQKIIQDQRQIISEVTGKEASSVPQSWALYKEVQEYYDKGMRVPDDVTLFLCDDNWGNIRKLPKISDKLRSGGYGIYYHYDYVGGPRNYKWLNTSPISRTWEQMHLAYRYGVDRIWIVNVGDIKPMEFPIEFFLDYAWNPDYWPAKRLPEYTRLWAQRQFGADYAEEIADILTKYTKYNSRRKPELLAPDTHSLTNYREAETVVNEYNELADKANKIYDSLADEYKDAFYQLVLHPVVACSNLNELYVTVGTNKLYAKQGRAATNGLAEKAKQLFNKDAEITHYYNEVMAGGKWNHMMDQVHIGYTYWQQPDENIMPEVKEIDLPAASQMGVAIEGSDKSWPEEKGEAKLPEFDSYNRQSYYIEVFNQGRSPFEYSAETEQDWIRVEPRKAKVETEKRSFVSVDWDKAPIGMHRVPIIITGPDKSQVTVQAIINNPSFPERDKVNGFVESNGYVSIEAEHYSRAMESASIKWQRIPDLGRTLSAMIALPVTAPAQAPGGNSPRLEYDVYLFTKGEVKVKAYLSPTQNFHNEQGLRYAVSFDNETPQIVNMHANKTFQDWEESVRNNITVEASRHTISEAGKHILKFWMVDPGVVLQKLVIETGEVKPSYLGPPESFNRTVTCGTSQTS
jgi:hypothetical protein